MAPTFVAVRTPESDAAPAPWTDAVDLTGVITHWLRPNEIAIVRPDRYTYGVESNPNDALALAMGLAHQLTAVEATI